MSTDIAREPLDLAFRTRLAEGNLPTDAHRLRIGDVGLSRADLMELVESQLISRRMDYLARQYGREKNTFYSIGSSGHEGNAAVARAFALKDMAFLHYRSGAFFVERARQLPGSTPVHDLALSFAASAQDPISGGRHKVIGSKALNIPPQTSTIASHLPKAVGTAFSIALARRQRLETATLASDAVVICSFGDASANHSTATGAINAASWTAFQNAPCPIVFVCEDNGIGISVPTPDGWIGANYGSRPGLTYIAADGLNLLDAWRGARAAAQMARTARRPVFLHLRTVRLMGHAGSDVEAAYRDKADIAAAEAQDPLLHSARLAIEAGAASADEILALDRQIEARARAAFTYAIQAPKLSNASDVMASIAPPVRGHWRDARAYPPQPTQDCAPVLPNGPQHMSRIIAATLAQEMARDRTLVVFGEDVGKKGGVYGATTRLQETFGRGRVVDTLLDEQTILGFAMGLSHNGFLPIPEIQFLAYLHNAEDQLRGEAATLPFFSNGQYANPMVVRIAGLGYQKGFGGHFHNDNALAVLRDIPGLIIACPSNAAEAAGTLRTCIRLAREEGRVCVHLEPIALYPVKDLHEPGDGLMAADLADTAVDIPFGRIGTFGTGRDVHILTYGNGTYLARRAARDLKLGGIDARILDLRWLKPLPMDDILSELGAAEHILIVDECRRTGSLSEELFTSLQEARVEAKIARLTAEDSFIPLGPAATSTLPSEESLIAAVRDLLRESRA